MKTWILLLRAPIALEIPMTHSRKVTSAPRHIVGQIAGIAGIVAAAVCLLAASASANTPQVIEVGTRAARHADMRSYEHIVFLNLAEADTRIVFAYRDSGGIACYSESEGVVRSRTGQYLLEGGAELICAVQPGRYRYTTLTSHDGSVRKARATLRVRE